MVATRVFVAGRLQVLLGLAHGRRERHQICRARSPQGLPAKPLVWRRCSQAHHGGGCSKRGLFAHKNSCFVVVSSKAPSWPYELGLLSSRWGRIVFRMRKQARTALRNGAHCRRWELGLGWGILLSQRGLVLHPILTV